MKGTVFSYLRMIIASWLFVGGLALQFWPSPAEVARVARGREDAWKDQKLSHEECRDRSTGSPR